MDIIVFARSPAPKWPKKKELIQLNKHKLYVFRLKAEYQTLNFYICEAVLSNSLNVSAEVQTGSSKIHYPSPTAHRQAALRGVRIPPDNKRSQVPVQPWPTL